MLTYINEFGKLKVVFENIAGAFIVPPLVYMISRTALRFAARVHWILGLVTSLPFIALIVLLLVGCKEDFFKKYPGRVVLSLFATVVLTGASVCAWYSFALSEADLACYESTQPLSAGRLTDYLIWVFIDMVPVMEIWSTLNVPAPVEPIGVVAGLPVLVFRALVVLPLITYFRKWLRVRKDG
ncbi:MAG: hypothetical protein ACYTEL_05235 [Planctomycetota bacterium]|jgi:hypothetical protein